MTSHAKVSDVELSKTIAALPDSIRPLGQCVECTAIDWRDRLQELSANNGHNRAVPVSVKNMVELILKIQAKCYSR